MKRIALLRKNSLFVATPRGGETAAILSSLTSTCRRHDINPQTYLTQLLANLPDTPVSQLDQWLPDEWRKTGHPVRCCFPRRKLILTNSRNLPRAGVRFIQRTRLP